MPKCDLYTIEMNRKRNYYNYEEFRYIMRCYRNQRFIGQEKKIEYEDNYNMERKRI